MSRSTPFTVQGAPSAALRNLFRVTNTPNLSGLLDHIRADPDTRLARLRLQRGVGPLFVNTLRGYLTNPPVAAAPVVPQPVASVAPVTYPTNIQITPRGTLRARKITVQHLATGRILTAPSVTALARRLKWGPNGPYHFDNVLKGNRLVHRGWGVPTLLNQRLALKNVFGNRYDASIGELTAKLGARRTNKLRRQGSTGALVEVSKDLSHVLAPKSYRVEGYLFHRSGYSGSGTPLVRLDQLSEAPERLGISYHSAWQLSRGLAQSIRGVTFLKAYTAQRRATEALEPVQA